MREKPRLFYGWYMVAISWLFIFLYSAVAVSIFFKPMLDDFGWDRATLSLVQSLGLIVMTVASPFLGRLIDRYGVRTMMLASMVAQVLSRTLNGMASCIWHLYLARFFYGVNSLPVSQVLVNNWFFRKRGMAQGILATGMPAGTLLLTPVSQYLIQLWGWRPTMFFWALVVLVVMLPLTLLIKNRPEDKSTGPDGESWQIAVTGGVNPGHNESVANTRPETHTAGSLMEAIKTRSLWFLGATQFFCGIGCGFMMTHIVIFATDLGYHDMIGASLVSVQGGLNLAGILVLGSLSDRIGRRKALSLTHIVRSLAFVTIVVFIISTGSPLWMLYAAMCLFGFGWFTSAPLAAGLVADLVGSIRMGTILGVMMSCHMIGMAVGSYAGGIIFELTGSYYLFFLIQGPLELLAAGLALGIKLGNGVPGGGEQPVGA